MNEDTTWTTYRMTDGSLIQGEYAWVDSPEAFEDVVDTTEAVKETWVLVSSEIVTFEPLYWDAEEYEDDEDEF